MTRARWLAPLVLALLHPRAIRAQVDAQVDVGVRGAPVAALGTRSLWSVSPALRYDTPRLRLMAEGEYRDYGRLGRGVSGAFGGSYLLPLSGPFLAEATGSLRGQAGGPIADAGLWDAGGRLHLIGPRAGGWMGSQAGHDPHGRTLRWEAAAWRRLGNVMIQLQGSQLLLTDRLLRSGVSPDTLTPPPDTLYRNQTRVSTDLAAWLHWSPPRSQIALALGRRYGVTEVAAGVGAPDGGLTNRSQTQTRATASTWWLADATYWVTPRWGITASVGRRPPDGQFRAPGGHFLQFAFRASLRGTARDHEGTPRVGRRLQDLRARRLDGRVVELQLLAPLATRLEIRGDFTDWRAIELERFGGGQWRVRLPITPGIHSLNVRYDGGPWQPPPGTQIVIDEFEQETGVLLID